VPTSRRAAGFLAVVALTVAPPLAAQDALNRVGPKTQVRSVDFQFDGKPSLDEDQLRQNIALTGQGGLVGIRRALGWIPFVPPVGTHPFDPTEMGRDIVRLERYYQRAGFPRADVDYEARYQAKSDAVQVTYRIDEGPPLEVDTLQFAGANGPLDLPESSGRSWRRVVRTELPVASDRQAR